MSRRKRSAKPMQAVGAGPVGLPEGNSVARLQACDDGLHQAAPAYAVALSVALYRSASIVVDVDPP